MGYSIQLAGLEGRRVLVTGGGPIAAGKLAALAEAGAKIHVVTREISPELDAERAKIAALELRDARPEDVDGAALVIAATNDRAANRAIAEAASARGILVNAVDDIPACTFFAPALVRRGPVTFAISTDGRSPLLAAQLRRLLEAAIPRSVSTFGDLLSRLRSRGVKGLAKRKRLLSALADPAIGHLVERGDTEAAADRLEALAGEEEERFDPGTVAIVGAGPGAKAHLTLRARDRIQRADVILHDALVEPEVLALALPGTRTLNVGRRAEGTCPGAEHTAHDVAIALMIREARSGLRVVRLHAGDAFVFGRGGEEADALDRAGVRWEHVPGVSAALAAPAAIGVPLTQRGEARGFSVRTGHTRTGYSQGELPKAEETVVVLMGLGAAREILRGLIADGYPPETPAAAISRATRPGERAVVATLATLGDAIEAAALEAPATLVVGNVVKKARLATHAESASPEVAA